LTAEVSVSGFPGEHDSEPIGEARQPAHLAASAQGLVMCSLPSAVIVASWRRVPGGYDDESDRLSDENFSRVVGDAHKTAGNAVRSEPGGKCGHKFTVVGSVGSEVVIRHFQRYGF